MFRMPGDKVQPDDGFHFLFLHSNRVVYINTLEIYCSWLACVSVNGKSLCISFVQNLLTTQIELT